MIFNTRTDSCKQRQSQGTGRSRHPFVLVSSPIPTCPLPAPHPCRWLKAFPARAIPRAATRVRPGRPEDTATALRQLSLGHRGLQGNWGQTVPKQAK